MKNTVSLTFVGLAFTFFTSCDSKNALVESKYPSKITEYVESHFQDNEIIQVIKERDGIVLTYNTILDNAVQLEFNRKFEITDIDGNDLALPNSVIPDSILEYVNTKFPNNFITDWELDDRQQKVELDNHLELIFNKKGEFLRIDD